MNEKEKISSSIKKVSYHQLGTYQLRNGYFLRFIIDLNTQISNLAKKINELVERVNELDNERDCKSIEKLLEENKQLKKRILRERNTTDKIFDEMSYWEKLKDILKCKIKEPKDFLFQYSKTVVYEEILREMDMLERNITNV